MKWRSYIHWHPDAVPPGADNPTVQTWDSEIRVYHHSDTHWRLTGFRNGRRQRFCLVPQQIRYLELRELAV